jgi:hypothetical protein
MTTRWVLVLLATGTLAVVGVVLLRRTGRAVLTPRRRTALGVVAAAVSVVVGLLLIGTRSVAAPEERGIGVVVDGVRSTAARGSDVGLTAALEATLADCGGPVSVSLTIGPTAEFWIDNSDALAESARVRVAVPDVGLKEVSVGTVDDGLNAIVSPQSAQLDETSARLVDRDINEYTRTTIFTLDVPRWGATLRPLVLRFTADWTERRTHLGSCYLRLPALVGLPTALSGAQIAGTSRPLSEAELPLPHSFFIVESREAGVRAYYNSRFEVTRGLATVELGDNTLREDSSTAPNANLAGRPAWTCRSSIPDPGFGVTDELDPADPAPDVLVTRENDSTPAFSSQRIEEILQQETCATFVAVEGPTAGPLRDLVLIAIGALFSIGVELLLSAFVAGRRRRRATGMPGL